MTSNLNNKTISSGSHNGGVVLHGYLKKLKTMKKKYFVLYEDCGKFLARLEYYDNEKKFKSKANPKRSIILNSCFNINRRLDTKHDFVITLSTKEEGFGIVMESEEEMNKWLRAMLKLQSGTNIFTGPPKPYYEHVWQVVVQRKGLAEKKGILGNYHVCLSTKSVTFIRIGLERTNIGEQRVAVIEFYLTSIRRCGDSKCYFYMEVGRHSVTGAGELWMETKDTLIAQNMYTMILNAMSNPDDPYGPMRKRSSSATETSKPVTILQRRQTHSGSKTLNSSPLSGSNRDRCDSLPSSRNRTTTESSGYNTLANATMPPSRTMSSLSTVPNSIYNRHSHSPPMNNNTLSPSVGCSESDGSTLSIDEPDSMKHSLTPDDNAGFVTRFYNSRSPGGVIPEENSDEFGYSENKKINCIENAFPKFNIPSSSNIHHSLEPESQYMDMFNSISPCETTVCDSTLAGAECNLKSCNDSSDGNSRASSLAEEVVDGYVHMSSPQTSDYVNMEQSLKQRLQFYNLNLSSNRGVIPGNPLKDMSFAEYPFEKVNSKIIADEDENQLLTERPPRAYSVGSRMEHNNQKLRIEIITNTDQNNCRVRAFSVGSRSKVPRCDLQRNVLMSATSCSSNNSNASNSKTSITSIEPTSETSVRGRKSSSAPLLIHKSQNSVDRMDDLMEIDFSKNYGSRSNSLSSQSPSASSYLPKGSHLRSSSILSSSPKQQNTANNSFSESTSFSAENGYLEMRPVIYSSHSMASNDEPVPNDNSIPELPETTRPQPESTTHNKSKTIEEWSKIDTPEGYLEMSFNGNKDNSREYNYELPFSNANKFRSLPSTKMADIQKIRDGKKMSLQSMPLFSPTQSLINNRNLATNNNNNNSKLSLLHQQPQIQAKPSNQTHADLGKSDTSQRKRFFDHVNSTLTISEEEKPSSAEQDVDLSEKFKNLLSARNDTIDDEHADPDVDLSTADTNCYDYVNFSAEISQQKSSPKRNEKDEKDEENKSIERKGSLHLKGESHDNSNRSKECKLTSSNSEDTPSDEASKFTRKSNSPKCTPTSPHSSSVRCHRLSNTNRHTKGTGYELSHISSDSSLQTRKNISRPSSVNSDRIFPLDTTTTQCRPSSVNSDNCLPLSSSASSSSAAAVCFSPPQRNCENRSQDTLLSVKSVPNDDQHLPPGDHTTTSPVSKSIAQCQPSSNPELELHYASLDLPKSSIKNSNTTIHGSTAPNSVRTEDTTTSTSLSPNSNASQQLPTSTYAKIDFNQCESKKFKCGTQQSNL